MARASHKDLRQLFEGLVQLYELRDRDEFAQYLLPVIKKLSQSDFATYFETNVSNSFPEYLKTVQYPHNLFSDNDMHVAATFSQECPTTQNFLKEGTLPTRFYSDFHSFKHWQNTNMYNLVYGPAANVTTYGAFSINDHKSFPVGVSFFRTEKYKPYSEEERLKLDLLRPHAAQAFANAILLTQLRQELTGLRVATDQHNRGVVGLSSKGAIQWTTPQGLRLLTQYFGNKIQADDCLPEMVTQWVHQEDARLDDSSNVPSLPSHLTIHNKKGTLTLRFIREGEARLLFLEEETDRFPVAQLQTLGLTKRESEIIHWVSYGKTNGEVATILGNKPRTIEKHLERVYIKLGVENRHAAVARVTELLPVYHGNGNG